MYSSVFFFSEAKKRLKIQQVHCHQGLEPCVNDIKRKNFDSFVQSAKFPFAATAKSFLMRDIPVEL